MSQFREFKLSVRFDGNIVRLFFNNFINGKPNTFKEEEQIHVVEIAALEAAQKEIEQLTAALKVAEDAIEREMKWRTVKYCTNDGLDNLREALNEIQKIKKGLA